MLVFLLFVYVQKKSLTSRDALSIFTTFGYHWDLLFLMTFNVDAFPFEENSCSTVASDDYFDFHKKKSFSNRFLLIVSNAARCFFYWIQIVRRVTPGDRIIAKFGVVIFFHNVVYPNNDFLWKRLFNGNMTIIIVTFTEICVEHKRQ